MKAKTIILILLFTTHSNLFSIGVIYATFKPAVHFEYSSFENSKSYNIGIDKLMFTKNRKSNRFFYQLDILNYSVIEKDIYNKNNVSKSFLLSGFNLFWLFATVGIPQLINDDDKYLDINDFNYIVLFPILLTNSTTYFDFFNQSTSKNSVFSSGIFLKSKLDYFSNDNSWWQYKPAFGIKLSQTFWDNVTNSNGGISLNFGLEKAFDFKDQKIITNNLSPYFSLKLFYMYSFQVHIPCESM